MLLTFTTYDEEVMKFAQTVVPDPVTTIRLRREEESLDNIKQFYVKCRDKEDKFQALSNMYGVLSIGQCIVFCHVRTSSLLQKVISLVLLKFLKPGLSSFPLPNSESGFWNVWRIRDSAAVRALASHQCSLGSILTWCHMWVVCCWFSFFSKGFSLGSSVFLPPEEPTLQIAI